MRRIKFAEVKRLALCKRGKNGLTTLYKSDGTAEFATMTKATDAEKGELLTVIWPKGLADEDGDFADTDTAIDSMMESLIANGGKLDIEHEGDVLPRGAVAIQEVFTIQKSDDRFRDWKDYHGNAVDVTGGAAARIKINDQDLRTAYRDGDWDGVSLFGPAAVEQVDIKAASQRVAARMGGIQETEMTKEELQAILDAQKAGFAELSKSLKEVLAAKSEKTEDAANATATAEAEQRPTFTGNVNDPQALADYENALRGYELRKAVSEGKMSADDIAEMRKAMAETGPSLSDLNEAGIEAKPEDSKEVRALQVQLFKARKRSNVPARTASAQDEVDELAKAATDEGLAIAQIANELMGSAPSSMKVIG
jgi:hypothetical protein